MKLKVNLFTDEKKPGMMQGYALIEIAKQCVGRIQQSGEIHSEDCRLILNVPDGNFCYYVETKINQSVWIDDGLSCYCINFRVKGKNWELTKHGKPVVIEEIIFN